MKKIFFYISLLTFLATSLKAQHPGYAPLVRSYGNAFTRLSADSALHVPRKSGLTLNDNDTTPQIIVKDTLLWYFASGVWRTPGSGGGGGGSGLNQLTQDVVAGPGTGSQPATVQGIYTHALPALNASNFTYRWNGSAWIEDSTVYLISIHSLSLRNGLHARNDTTAVWGTIPGSKIDTITTIDGNNAFPVTFDNFQAASGRGFRVNFGSDAGWDMIVRDSATGFWTRIPKGTVGQSFQMLSTGGVGWAAQTGTAQINDTVSTYTSGATYTVPNGTNILILNPSSTIASLTITMPARASVKNVLKIYFGGTLTTGNVITALSFTPNTSQTIVIGPTTPTNVQAGDQAIEFRFVGTQWIRGS